MTKTFETAAAARQFIADAAAYDRQAVLDAIVEWNNTTENDIGDDGSIWVANPQSGHWLNDEQLIEFAAFIA